MPDPTVPCRVVCRMAALLFQARAAHCRRRLAGPLVPTRESVRQGLRRQAAELDGLAAECYLLREALPADAEVDACAAALLLGWCADWREGVGELEHRLRMLSHPAAEKVTGVHGQDVLAAVRLILGG